VLRLNPPRLAGPAVEIVTPTPAPASLPVGHKWCNGCSTVLPIERFGTDRRKVTGRASRCLDCTAARSREWYAALTDEMKRQQYRDLRDAAEAVYGAACATCGATADLQFDHPNDDGKAHRAVETPTAFMRRIRRTGRRCATWAVQLLCATCHRRATADRRRAAVLARQSLPV
jgi:hypothetical protein